MDDGFESLVASLFSAAVIMFAIILGGAILISMVP